MNGRPSREGRPFSLGISQTAGCRITRRKRRTSVAVPPLLRSSPLLRVTLLAAPMRELYHRTRYDAVGRAGAAARSRLLRWFGGRERERERGALAEAAADRQVAAHGAR